MWLFVLFLMVPLIEIALFIQIGGLIGLWPTLGVVIATAFLGTWLVRSQGRLALENLRQSFGALKDPTEPLAHGAMILFSGALLLTPGFFTDAIGFALMVPGIRSLVFHQLQKRVTLASVVSGQAQWSGHDGPQETVIEGEFEVDETPRDGPSAWRRD
ncbi:FxsA family protein [Rhodophyticola sp. CCM32]|uniref:FxsA family protein n=1 Tax=Rhodophyticola sp. CCM32 TaxID=2916397 RepID=UPI00107FA302|nr:FxsA family protein [Rhodophyticola sp. CCM32]QBY02067.1 FxsA family protein [Rhodophyticola sp. CCM32]